MADAVGSFALLIDLAKEDSSEKRRELLRKVSDAFLDTSHSRSEREAELFDEIVGAVAADLETHVRTELARKVATSRLPIRRTARRLALDAIEVARPVIESSPALTQGDLVDIIQQTTQDHMMAVTKRPDIGEKVSSALVAKGGDNVVAALLENPSARLSRETYERVADRASHSPVLHAPFIRNKGVSLDLLNAVYFSVSVVLRREIIGKFQGATAADIESALDAGRDHLSTAYGALPNDYQLAKEYVDALAKRGALQPAILETILRDNKRTSFLIALARLVEVDFDLASRLVKAQDLDALAILCRNVGFERDLFVTLCVMIIGGGGGLNKAQRYGETYARVPIASAQRAVRFWRVRASIDATASSVA